MSSTYVEPAFNVELSRGVFYDTLNPHTPLDVTDPSHLAFPWVDARVESMSTIRSRYVLTTADMHLLYLPPGAILDDYQLESLGYILSGDDTLLGDDAGLGKTVIMACALNAIHARKVLIICPSVVKYNWRRELLKWRKYSPVFNPKSICIVEGDNIDLEADTIIINYDIVVRHIDELLKLDFDVLICDESHRIKNVDAKRTKAILGGTKKMPGIKARKRIFASATQANRPIDFWSMCKACDSVKGGLGEDWFRYVKRYCGARRTPYGLDVKGASNLEELGQRMRDKFYIRHDDSVLNLPPYKEAIIAVPLTQQVVEAQENLILALLGAEDDYVPPALTTLSTNLSKAQGDKSQIAAISESALKIVGAMDETQLDDLIKGMRGESVSFKLMAVYRKAVGLGKVKAACDYIKLLTESRPDEPLLIFAHHKEVISAIRDFVANDLKLTVETIIGGMSAAQKDKVRENFQDGKTKIVIANLMAGGEGITMTASNWCLFVEADWNATTIRQCLKRIHRRTQTRSCTIEYLFMDDTLDIYMGEMFLTKRSTIDAIDAA